MPRQRITKRINLNPKEEAFCRYYAQHSELFGNGTLSYAAAYNYKLDGLSQEPPRDENGVVCGRSEHDRAYAVCSSQAYLLLRKPYIQARCTALLNALLEDKIIDREMTRVVMQNRDLHAKMTAIREYNKLKKRMIERAEMALKVGELEKISKAMRKIAEG